MLGLVGRSRKGTLRREALLVDAVGDGGRDGRREGADEGAEARVGEEAAVAERPAGGGVRAAEGEARRGGQESKQTRIRKQIVTHPWLFIHSLIHVLSYETPDSHKMNGSVIIVCMCVTVRIVKVVYSLFAIRSFTKSHSYKSSFTYF